MRTICPICRDLEDDGTSPLPVGELKLCPQHQLNSLDGFTDIIREAEELVNGSEYQMPSDASNGE